MFRFMIRALYLVAGIVVLLTAPSTCSADEPQRFDGDWELVSQNMDGDEVPLGASDRIKIKNGAMGEVLTWTKKDGVTKVTAQLVQDPTGNMQHVDMIFSEQTNGEEQKRWTLPGLWEMAGSNLTLCFPDPGSRRPLEIKPKRGVTILLHKRLDDNP